MIKPEQIPDEVANAAADCYWSENNKYWQDIVAAAINAWPKTLWDYAREGGVRVILPLPQEKNDD